MFYNYKTKENVIFKLNKYNNNKNQQKMEPSKN